MRKLMIAALAAAASLGVAAPAMAHPYGWNGDRYERSDWRDYRDWRQYRRWHDRRKAAYLHRHRRAIREQRAAIRKFGPEAPYYNSYGYYRY